MIVALLLAALPAVLNAQVNTCLGKCRNEVLACVRKNVNLANHANLARCILEETDGDTESECGICVVGALGANGCSNEDGTTDLDCVDEVMNSDRCNTTFETDQEGCDGDSSCEWCSEYDTCASITRCVDFKPTPAPKEKKDKNKGKFECVAMEGADAEMEISCKQKGAKKKCQNAGCDWIRKAEPNPADGGENSITTMAQLKKACQSLFSEDQVQECKKGCSNAKIRKGKCTPGKNPPSNCRKFADPKVCELVAGCTGGGKKKFACKGTPDLEK